MFISLRRISRIRSFSLIVFCLNIVVHFWSTIYFLSVNDSIGDSNDINITKLWNCISGRNICFFRQNIILLEVIRKIIHAHYLKFQFHLLHLLWKNKELLFWSRKVNWILKEVLVWFEEEMVFLVIIEENIQGGILLNFPFDNSKNAFLEYSLSWKIHQHGIFFLQIFASQIWNCTSLFVIELLN